MEPEKAAEYYDELVKKGGNAAKFKQGLGFGTHETSVPRSGDAEGPYGGFVRAASPGRAAALDKEIRVEGIRDKLKKQKGASSREGFGSRARSPDNTARRNDADREAVGGGRKREVRGRSSPSSGSEEAERSPATRRVREEKRGRLREKYSDSSSYDGSSPSPDGRTVRRRDRSVSPADDGSAKRRRKSLSRSERARSPSRSHRGRRSDRDRSLSRGRDAGVRGRSGRGRDRSRSPADDRRSELRTTSSPARRRRRSSSRSRRDRGRVRSRSRSRGRASDYRRERPRSPYDSRRRRSRSPHDFHKRRSRSPYDSHRRRSRSPRASGPPDDYETYSGRTGRSRGGFKHSRGKYEDDREGDRSSTKQRVEAKESEVRSRRSSMKENRPDRKYSKRIPNFESLTPAEKVKATTKLQLAETVVKDQVDGNSNEWERFDFDKNAPLDDDAKLDYFGDGTGAKDDSIFLNNTGSTYFSSSNQVKREELVAAAHEAAIFGPPEGLSLRTTEFDDQISTKENRSDGAGSNPGDREKSADDHQQEQARDFTSSSNVVSEQVVAMQKAGSWQERAQKMREARQGALTNS